MEKEKKNELIIKILIAVIIVLALMVIYAFIVRPAILKKQIKVYNQGYSTAQVDFLNGIVAQLNQQNYVQIPLANNQTLYLRQFNPKQTSPKTPSE